MTIAAPQLETDRLRLRAHRADDLAACAAMWADPDVVRHIGGKPASRQESWMKILRYGGLWPLLGYGYWAVEEKTTGQFIGELGFADFMREMQPPIAGVPELGWAFASAFHGKGYATEGLQAALHWAGAHLDAPATVCLIDPGNVASVRVAQKVGYVEKERSEIGGTQVVLFERLRSLHS